MVAEVRLCRPSSPEEWAEKVKHVNVIAGPPKVGTNFLKECNNLELIQCFGIGYDYIDVPSCTSKGVIVCNVAEIYSESVAQHAWALILDLSKKVTKADRLIRAGTWQKEDWMGLQLWGKTLGIIGLGGIGSRVALKGRLAFNMRILAFDPYLLSEKAQLFGAELVSLEEVMKRSDIIVVSVPLTPATLHMIGKKEFVMMKKSSFIINICRGSVIESKALIASLQKGQISGAGLDVTDPEPLPLSSPLLKMDNVVLTPHVASSTIEAVEKTYLSAVNNIITYLKGRKPYWMINPEIYK
jgi:phosphoglycerate dehydrogenase-like enzyme